MVEYKLTEKVKQIELPEDMQQRIIEKCCAKMGQRNRNTAKYLFKKTMAAVSIVLCLCLAGSATLAVTEKLEGFFKDVKRWDGAVIGTSYEQATDEVEINVIREAGQLIAEITFLKPNIVPYSEFETFGIESYKIVDQSGSAVAENEPVELSMITDGKVRVFLNDISRGKYRLIVSKLIGSKKADQPLLLHGMWECEFTY